MRVPYDVGTVGGMRVTAEARQFEAGQEPTQSEDFLLAPHEIAKGERATSA